MAQKDMLINFVPGEECRIAVVEDSKLEELYTERASSENLVGNIYRGRITNVEPSIQAAFVDFGIGRNGFLHISDLHPRYFPGEGEDTTEKVGKKTPRRNRPPIQQCLRRGQQVLVQVLKEGIGTKGPTLTTYLSIPGRFLVMMPYMERLGVSRKVEDEEKRREMRKILDDLNPPDDFGFIIRTAGMGRTKTELKRDMAYLQRLWRTIKSRMKQGSGPAELYTESNLVIRTIRDVLTNDIERVIVDDSDAAQQAREFLRIAMPRGSTKVIYYDKPLPLFDAFDIERQIETIHSRVVPLPSGGSLVIDATEALVAIDVNSGKFRENTDAEQTAYKTNLEAADEICRQLRLRDLGGVIVNDLIDMYVHSHRREVEKRFRDNLKKDRARTKPLRISELGLLEMTRQRMRPSLKKSIYRECPACRGSGHIKTAESVVLHVMRRLAVFLSSEQVHRVELVVSTDIVTALVNRKRHALALLEQQLGKTVTLRVESGASPDLAEIVAFDLRGGQIDQSKLPRLAPPDLTALPEEEVIDEDLEIEEVEESRTDLEEEAEKKDAEQKPRKGEKEKEKAEKKADEEQEESGKRRRRRRRRRSRRSDEAQEAPSSEKVAEKQEEKEEPQPEQKPSEERKAEAEEEAEVEAEAKGEAEAKREAKAETGSKAKEQAKSEVEPTPSEEGGKTSSGRSRRSRSGRRTRRSSAKPEASDSEKKTSKEPSPAEAKKQAEEKKDQQADQKKSEQKDQPSDGEQDSSSRRRRRGGRRSRSTKSSGSGSSSGEKSKKEEPVPVAVSGGYVNRIKNPGEGGEPQNERKEG